MDAMNLSVEEIRQKFNGADMYYADACYCVLGAACRAVQESPHADTGLSRSELSAAISFPEPWLAAGSYWNLRARGRTYRMAQRQRANRRGMGGAWHCLGEHVSDRGGTELIDPATQRGLDALDELTLEWWNECGLDEAVAQIAAMIPGPFKERAFASISGLLKQSHMEGLYRGFLAGKDFAAKTTEEELR